MKVIDSADKKKLILLVIIFLILLSILKISMCFVSTKQSITVEQFESYMKNNDCSIKKEIIEDDIVNYYTESCVYNIHFMDIPDVNKRHKIESAYRKKMKNEIKSEKSTLKTVFDIYNGYYKYVLQNDDNLHILIVNKNTILYGSVEEKDAKIFLHTLEKIGYYSESNENKNIDKFLDIFKYFIIVYFIFSLITIIRIVVKYKK